jgi:hypothetical protein
MTEFPKWVQLHKSQVVDEPHVHAPGLQQTFVQPCTNILSVLVDDLEEEAKALMDIFESKDAPKAMDD